jgi:hypothetical protein
MSGMSRRIVRLTIDRPAGFIESQGTRDLTEKLIEERRRVDGGRTWVFRSNIFFFGALFVSIGLGFGVLFLAVLV